MCDVECQEAERVAASESSSMLSALSTQVRITEADELSKRVDELEARLEAGK